jgi:hypothetical protein
MTDLKPSSAPTEPPSDDGENAAIPLAAIETEPATPGRFRAIARRALRILAVMIVLAAVGVGIYFGWPVVYDRYIRPVETNTADLSTLEEQLGDATARIAELEAESAALSAAQADTSVQVTDLARTIDEHTSRLDALDAIAADLSTASDELSAAFDSELGLLRSMELLSRARLFLYQANYGLAAQDLTAARAILADLDSSSNTAIEEAIFRLDLSIGVLPDRPVAASDDLDIAWQALLGDYAAPTPTTTTTPTPTSPTTIPTTTTVPTP